MGAGWILGAGSHWAGALLVIVTVLRTHLAHCTEPPRRVVFQAKSDCHFTNGTERVRFLDRHIYNRQQLVHFDSDVGVYVGDTELGRDQAELWNKNPAKLAHARAAVDTFCRNNYEAAQMGKMVGRTVQPKVKVSPTKSESEPHPHLLVCSVTGFYPGGIEIKWLKNGQEQTAGVVSTELLQNGDWTFQILVMLEMSPQRGDVYTCQVEHISLRGPIAVQPVDFARSKMLTGVGALMLGYIPWGRPAQGSPGDVAGGSGESGSDCRLPPFPPPPRSGGLLRVWQGPPGF
uniref:Ig-like domain-containing protein n=1 Tax=Chelonoidis abingdonii TaxID=106734 RepID=A0A8C0G476_CHEAB